jgi:hypothetical protein
VTAPEKLHRSVSVHPGSELAVKDSNRGWSKIHRVRSITKLSVRETSYIVVCGLHIETEETAHPLKSGHLLGRCCRFCWGSLVDEAGVAA